MGSGFVKFCAIVVPQPEAQGVPFFLSARYSYQVSRVWLTPVVGVRLIFVFTPLQLSAVADVVIAVEGCTVLVIVVGNPKQPSTDSGVTIYCSEPSVVVLGLVNICAIVKTTTGSACGAYKLRLLNRYWFLMSM